MNTNELYEKRHSFFLEAPAALKAVILISLIAGLAAMVLGFAQGLGERIWGSFLVNLFFFFCLGLGAMAFSAIQDVVGAQWARPIRRIQEGFGAFVPIGGLLFVIYLIAVAIDLGHAGQLYRWIADPEMLAHFPGKKSYLQPGWFYIRMAIVLVAIVSLAVWQLRLSTSRDRAFIDGKPEQTNALGQEVKTKLRFWSAPILVVYGVAFTFLCFDLTMSLMPTWFSTLWGGWHFAVMMQTLMASLLIVMFALRSSEIGAAISRQQFHDVGKLMHGFTIFFAYLTYAHVLTYWYGNVPEETEYFLHRMHAPWIYLVYAIPLLGFVIPLYVLIFKPAKWNAKVAIPISALILFAQWLTYILVVMPQVVEGSEWGGFPVYEVGMFLGMFGLFAATFLWFAKRNPMLPLGDPLLAEALAGEHH